MGTEDWSRHQRGEEAGSWVRAYDAVHGHLERQRGNQSKGSGQQAKEEETANMRPIRPCLLPQPSEEGETTAVLSDGRHAPFSLGAHAG